MNHSPLTPPNGPLNPSYVCDFDAIEMNETKWHGLFRGLVSTLDHRPHCYRNGAALDIASPRDHINSAIGRGSLTRWAGRPLVL